MNTFLIGAQKSGTTFLVSLLRLSSQICVSTPKEPQFFSKHFDSGLESYHRHFDNPTAPINLDASTTYSFLRAVGAEKGAPGLDTCIAERIKTYNPEAKIIYIMRDPVDRCKSALRHKARQNDQLRGRISIMDEIHIDPMLELVSTYSAQAEIYLSLFPRDNILFLSFDDLKKEPQIVSNRVCFFLGIDPISIPKNSSALEKHTAFVYRGKSRILFQFLSSNQKTKSIIKTLLPIKMIKTILTRRIYLEFTDTDTANMYFASEKERVLNLTGLKL